MTTTIITGCSTGIGYATALRLAKDGHHVVATMRNPDAFDLTSVAKEQNLDVDVRPLDVNDADAVDELFNDVLAAGPVDVLVNNAGIGKGGVVEETPLDVFREVMETNFFAALRCTRAVLPSMREHRSGAIVNVTSQAGRFAAPSMGAYTASKYALEGATECLAVEMAPFGIRVALIEPGSIMTAIWSKVDMTPPSGPYTEVRRRLGRAVMHDLPHSSPSEVVADCIAEALTTDSPKLRWLTGRGAERNVATRSALTDEAWIELWNGPDEAFVAGLLREE